MDIPWAALGDISGWAVAFVFVYFIATGRLVPRSTLEDAKAVATTWQAAWTTAMATIKEKAATDAELLENSRTTVRIVQALPRPADRPAATSASEASP